MTSPHAEASADGHPAFTLIAPELLYFADPSTAESGLHARAACGEAVAQIWHAQPSLVVPGSYRRFPRFESVREDFAASGCPVFVRQSGGGLVPQGPGIINVTLCYPIRRTLGDAAGDCYEHLCQILSDALATLDIKTGWQAVAGSFCDGRYNLACGEGQQARKIAGTAQRWQVVAGQEDKGVGRHVVLAHAVLLVTADLALAHQHANRFEMALGSGRHYQPEKTVTVAEMCPGFDDGLRVQTVAALFAAIKRLPPP